MLLLVRVFGVLSFQKLLVVILPLRYIKKTNDFLVHRKKLDNSAISRIVWAVKVISAHLQLFGFSCLVQATSIRILLGNQNNAKVCIGVAKDDKNGFMAHAWVKWHDKVIIGEDRIFVQILEWN